jgi:hypothetical protein
VPALGVVIPAPGRPPRGSLRRGGQESTAKAGDARALPTPEKVCDQVPDICSPQPCLERGERRRRNIGAVLLQAGEHEHHGRTVAHAVAPFWEVSAYCRVGALAATAKSQPRTSLSNSRSTCLGVAAGNGMKAIVGSANFQNAAAWMAARVDGRGFADVSRHGRAAVMGRHKLRRRSALPTNR